MKITKTIALAALLAVGMACSYSHKTTPPSAGTVPTISALSPNTAKAGSPNNSMMVTGTNFNSATTVNWTANASSTVLTGMVFTNSGLLTVPIPDADVAAAGTATVTVTNPGTMGGQYGGGTLPETSNSMTFTITP